MKSIIAIVAVALVAACADGPEKKREAPMTDQRFAAVQAGMTQEDVRRLAGEPLRTMPFPLSGNNSWEYIGYDTFGYYCEYSVTFGPDARVVSKLVNRVNAGGNKGP